MRLFLKRAISNVDVEVVEVCSVGEEGHECPGGDGYRPHGPFPSCTY